MSLGFSPSPFFSFVASAEGPHTEASRLGAPVGPPSVEARRCRARPPAPQPPYRTEGPSPQDEEELNPKQQLKRMIQRQQAANTSPGGPPTGAPATQTYPSWGRSRSRAAAGGPLDLHPHRGAAEGWGPPSVKAPRRVRIVSPASDAGDEGPPIEAFSSSPPVGAPGGPPAVGAPRGLSRRSSPASCSFVCRAHGGRHLHLLDLGLSGAANTPEAIPRGVHQPHCSSAYLRLRRCSCRETELPAACELGPCPLYTREPHFEGPLQGPPPTEEEAHKWFARRCKDTPERDQQQQPYEAPQQRANRLGLDVRYYLRNYSDPKLLYGE